LTTPEAARVSVDDTLSKFDPAASTVLLRYLAGNGRWEVQEEGGKVYAVRRELIDDPLAPALNGFYATIQDGQVRQTRVLLSFGAEYGFGVEHGNVTRANPGAVDVSVVVEGEHIGTPGYSSYLIVRGPAVNLEIYDQAPTVERASTS
jgi:hypothetical protein